MFDDIPQNRPFDAYQSFVLDCKLYWTRTIFPELRKRYAVAAGEDAPKTGAEVAQLMKDDTTAQFFGWYERHLQRMKYSGQHGLAVHYSQYREEIARALNADVPPRLLDIDPNFEQPVYYTNIDIHQHPGGVWSDEIAGYVYERGAQSTAPMLKKHATLWDRVKKQAMDRAQTEVKRVVDMGCGFGASTYPFYADHPDIDVIGLELSAPCLRLAAQRAAEAQAQNVLFKQADAMDTGLEEGSADIVTSTMVLHEMPPSHIKGVFKESHRLLAPGGLSIHLDFLVRDDAFKEYIHYGHSARNNEPFMVPLNQMDVIQAHKDAGFDEVEIVPFEEMDGALDPSMTAWRFPWTLIIARKAA
ncbi:class I SAM-dependent methyltransferase [Chachezhania sediminis]|uniref:class I SAM-dependent methyltransferase n=1 Tax=Chachezhania sediminis TaxID=2599291 RepID=UPI00131B5788|nr:class I SAM-dependent methyltransferase [Chachezhania sediminis]